MELLKATEKMNRNRPPMGMVDLAPQWLVNLQAIEYPETNVVEVVAARDRWEAIWLAFGTRNMPDNWVVTEVEQA